MKVRAVLNGIAALCAIGAFYTFAFCMVDDASDAEISKEYYFNTATEQTEQETEASVLKAEMPVNISGILGNDRNGAYLPDSSDNERVSSHISNTPGYQASPDNSSEDTAPAATPIYTAPEATTEVPVSAEDTAATESAGADTEASKAEPADDTEYDMVPEDTDLDIVISENTLGEAVIENNSAFADEEQTSPDLLSELDKGPTQEEIMQKLGEMQSEYNSQTEPAPESTVDFWSSYYPDETTTVSSTGTYFETIPSFSEPVPSETELTTTTPEGTEIVTARFDGSVQEINAYDLVCMIVSTEMSPSFDQEALKAQAVAAYSYVKYHNVNGLIPSVLVKHDIPDEVRQAVDAVFGKCCYYNGTPAQTVYTASSAGTTASAENVWGGNPVPYLTSVSTPFDIASDPNYGVITTFSESYIRSAFESYLGITLSDDPANWLTVTGRIDGNYVSSVNVDGQVTISGRKIRENVLKFGIKSWCFDVSYADGEFTFVTYGYGHGVGMSQNGANILAKQGYTYDQILQYYFPGITIS
ncbi:MAG: SpoIID/LytB domain-containing protein [Huintestinicola sp.]|uniref:SpoIID/LytB domain-containing protein n=1 Tax=Huintestinicola sp. TaxID=2981661 RepID=UPI003F0A3913